MIRFTALIAIIVMALFGSAVAMAEEPDATYKVRPGRSVTFVTPSLSYADRLDCEERFGGDGHHLQKPNSANTRCEYGATETNGLRNLQRTACRGPFTYSLPFNYGKLDPDAPDSARNVIVRPNGARWTVAVPDETQIGEVFRVTITIEGVNDIYFNNIHDGFQLSFSGRGMHAGQDRRGRGLGWFGEGRECRPRRGPPWQPRVQDDPLLAQATTSRPTRTAARSFSSTGRPPGNNKPRSTSSMSWCGDFGEYAPNGRRLADLCAEANVDCRRY